jgi:hypothetical protein
VIYIFQSAVSCRQTSVERQGTSFSSGSRGLTFLAAVRAVCTDGSKKCELRGQWMEQVPQLHSSLPLAKYYHYVPLHPDLSVDLFRDFL